MDNSNNTDPLNNQSPKPSGTGGDPQTPTPPIFNPTPPSTFDPSQTPSSWDQNPTQPPPTSSQTPASEPSPLPDSTPASIPTYPPPSQPLDTGPLQNQPASPPDTSQTFQSPIQQTQSDILPPIQSSQPVTSPLDNPWGAPIQPPPINGSTPASTTDTSTYSVTPDQPTTPEPQAESPYTTAPPWSNQPTPSQSGGPALENPPTPSPIESEPAPTDLSHLIQNNITQDSAQAAGIEAETLVAPTEGTPEIPTVPTEGRKGFPKWLIGVGAGLLIIVAGASAYFILGVGQGPKTTTSIPAETAPGGQVKPPAPIPTPITQPPAATGSANFGELQGSGTQQATSAADLLRQRQQGR